jgi:hypothetical protein
MREAITMARMQKAAAIMQFKLEGQTIARHPEWGLDHRQLMHRIDLTAGTIEVDNVIYPLKDKHFPTLDETDPYALSYEEATCLAQLRTSFSGKSEAPEPSALDGGARADAPGPRGSLDLPRVRTYRRTRGVSPNASRRPSLQRQGTF